MADWASNQPEWAEAALRGGDLKGDSQLMIPQLLQLEIQLESMLSPEMRWARRMGLFVSYLTQAAVAAQLAQLFWQVEGQNQSNALAVIEKVIIANPTAAQQFVHMSLVSRAFNAGATLPGGICDARGVVGTASVLRGFATSNAAAATTSNRSLAVRVPAGTTLMVDVPFVVTNRDDGGGLVPMFAIENQVANDQLVAGIIWRERTLLTSER